MGRCLAEHAWKISYGPGDDRLRDFYIPVLSRAVAYDRTAGFFSSSALAVAAAGLAHLVRTGGHMRLLVGAALSESDIQAVERGEEAFVEALEERLLKALEILAADPTDPARQRLEVLAWMVKHGTLEIRVVLPTGPDQRPLPAPQAVDYFHAKEGLFTDACGHQLAFSGSINESAQAWLRNYEQFAVYFSWEATRPYLLQVAQRFQRLWDNREEGWMALRIPEAVRHRLLRLAPDEPPVRDPLEKAPVRSKVIPRDQTERIVFQFLRDAPYLPGGEQVGLRTAGVSPWPHQARVVDTVIARFPERFLLADEVGLGKTIEAGLVLRSLILGAAVRRCLILVPRSILWQWQEELYEKFSLNVPVYDGRYRDYFRRELTPPTGTNPWDAYPVLLASSHLAKRRERRAEVLAAGPWDLVVVDEAHHARRRDFREERYRPNRLLSLLEGSDGEPGLARRTRGLLLLTATPMQVHPLEVWDLLRQLGLPPRWGASERSFLRFFRELQVATQGGPADWPFLLAMARDGMEGPLPRSVLDAVRDRVGVVEAAVVEGIFLGSLPGDQIRELSPGGKAALLELCRRGSPLGQKMFRSTRHLLRRYREAGLLEENIPEREPEPVWIRMSPDEWALYERVEDYVADYYQRYEGERRGLGFIMTVYRRRLTSSFAALRESLRRRLDYLTSLGGPAWGIIEEDYEDEDLRSDVTETLEDAARPDQLTGPLRRLLELERRVVEELLADVSRLTGDEKFVQLVDDLQKLLARRDTVAVFTHYTDTMDYLRDRLVGLYGRHVACYSGRGGERWDGQKWVLAPKEEVKNAFRAGEVRILLATEAAREGLNLQTCGVLINYDMPWNPMRLEQRIGRFDRIGQRYPDVWIHHYFLLGSGGEETVESRVYRALADRIDWFRAVVGDLQPILARIPDIIEKAAVAPRRERERVIEDALADLRRSIEEQEADLRLGDWSETEVHRPRALATPVSLEDLERVLRTGMLATRFSSHPGIPGAYELDFEGRLWEVTFDPALADAHPGRLRLLTYGEELLGRLLSEVNPPVPSGDHPRLVRVAAGPMRWWFATDTDGQLTLLEKLSQVEEALQAAGPPVTADHEEQARSRVLPVVQEVQAREQGLEELERRRERETLEERARNLLARAAACWAATKEMPPVPGEALAGVLAMGYPWAPLARLAGTPQLAAVQDEMDATARPGNQRSVLLGLAETAKELLGPLARLVRSDGTDTEHPVPSIELTLDLYCLPDV